MLHFNTLALIFLNKKYILALKFFMFNLSENIYLIILISFSRVKPRRAVFSIYI